MSMDHTVRELAVHLLQLEKKRGHQGLSPEEAQQRRELFTLVIMKIKDQDPGDRRKYLRIPADLEVRLRMKDATIVSNAAEISLGGLSLRGNIWISKDQEITIENLRIGRRDFPLAIQARIAWKSPSDDESPGAGLAFLDLDEYGRRQILAVYEELFIAYLQRIVQ